MRDWAWVVVLSPILVLGGFASSLFRGYWLTHIQGYPQLDGGTSRCITIAYPTCALVSLWAFQKLFSIRYQAGKVLLFISIMLILLLLVEIPITIMVRLGWIKSWRRHIIASSLSGILIPVLPKILMNTFRFFSTLVGPWTTGLCAFAVILITIIFITNEWAD